MDYFTGEPCDQCESTIYCIVDALRVCQNGHEQGEGQIAGEDEDDFGTHGTIVRKKVERIREKTYKVYRGQRAYRLYVQAYQFVLWKQCYALIHGKCLPAELWYVVRDLWALRLSKLLQQVESPQPDGSKSKPLSSVGESGDDDSRTWRKRTGEGADFPKLIETIALCYMGILLLRLPIGLHELYRWVKEEEVLYVRAIQGVPVAMREKLPGEYHEALDTTVMLRPDQLHNAVSDLATLYRQSFGLALPHLNHEVLLYRYILYLALPLEIFPAVQGLAQMTRSDFRYMTAKEGRRKQGSAFPEMHLMSLLVIAVKLLYPFDGAPHRPQSINELPALHIDWASWERQRQTSVRRSPGAGLPRGSEIEVRDVDVFRMNQQELDSYMDWYQKTWIKESRPRSEDNMKKEILDMFPLSTLDRSVNTSSLQREKELDMAATKKAQHMTSSMTFQQPLTEGEPPDRQVNIKRPGEVYRSYRSEEDLPETAKGFFEAAAEIACTSIRNLILAVRQSEGRIALWKRANHRAEVTGEELDLDAEMRRGTTYRVERRMPEVMEGMNTGESVESEWSAGEGSDVDVDMIES